MNLQDTMEELWKWHSLCQLDLSTAISEAAITLLDTHTTLLLDRLQRKSDTDNLTNLTFAYTVAGDLQGKIKNHYGRESKALRDWLAKYRAILDYEHEQLAARIIREQGPFEAGQGVPSRWMAMVVPCLTRVSVEADFRATWLRAIARELLALTGEIEHGEQAILTVHLIMRMTMHDMPPDDHLNQLALDICAREHPTMILTWYAERAEELYQQMGSSLKFL